MIDILGKAKIIAGQTWHIGKQYAPEILLGLGAAGFISTVVLASKETIKAKEIVDEFKETRESIEAASTLSNDIYSPKDKKEDIVKIYSVTAKNLLKVYWPSITTGAFSLACVFGSYGIMRHRNATLAAAATAVSQAFAEYKKRVAEAVGEEKEADIRAGRIDKNVEVVDTDEEGKETKKKQKVKIFKDANGLSEYARCFCEGNPLWHPHAETNRATIMGIQNELNDLLNSRGWLSLSEAYERLGFNVDTSDPKFKEYQLLGWKRYRGGKHTVVDFGLTDGYRQATTDFVNGRERSVWLDFNVDGLIY